ncbi:MAG: hypothetical protein J3K34DRAFT_448519, partial [Monoraphidium minutum]
KGGWRWAVSPGLWRGPVQGAARGDKTDWRALRIGGRRVRLACVGDGPAAARPGGAGLLRWPAAPCAGFDMHGGGGGGARARGTPLHQRKADYGPCWRSSAAPSRAPHAGGVKAGRGGALGCRGRCTRTVSKAASRG